MNESQVAMKFELLPNEILIWIMEYLSLFDIFYSFHYLNDRFNQLIRSIPLHLNFTNISKSRFDQFCKLLELNPKVKNQIYSLELSNKDTFGQIEAFLSLFSLNEFSSLHSLTVIQPEINNIEKLTSMLPLMPALHSYHCDTLLPIPLESNIDNFLSITNLSIPNCSLSQLLTQLFRCIPMLKYLNIQNISESYTSTADYSNDITHQAVHLKELIILNFEYRFNDLERLIKHTPNLIRLELCGRVGLDMIDANRWESLITNSLIYLDIFKFIFNLIEEYDQKIILEQFQQFQKDFWLIKHPWHTEYSLSKYSQLIYTVPFMLDYYELNLDTNRYWNQSLNTLDKVTNLTLYYGTIKEGCQYYFTNVTSLTILPSKESNNNHLDKSSVQSLKKIINLSNLTYFGVSYKFKLNAHSFLSELVKESPRLSSMKISPQLVSGVLSFDYRDNLERCSNRMITKMIYINMVIHQLNIVGIWIDFARDFQILKNSHAHLMNKMIYYFSSDIYPSYRF